MITNGAVVVIKRGDSALADILETDFVPEGKHAKKKTVEDIKAMERDYNIMRVSHNEKIKQAMAESKRKYRRKQKPTPKPLLYVQVGYAMAVCGVQAVHKKLAKKTNRIMKILGIRSKNISRRGKHV
jgi:hypothetical protein